MKVKKLKKEEVNMLYCLSFIADGIKQGDKEMVRSYSEQFYDLLPGWLCEEK